MNYNKPLSTWDHSTKLAKQSGHVSSSTSEVQILICLPHSKMHMNTSLLDTSIGAKPPYDKSMNSSKPTYF